MMNDELEKLMKEALSTSGTYDAAKGERVKKEVADMYDQKLKTWRYIIWAFLAIDTLVIIAAINMFIWGSSVKVLIGSAAVVLLTFESTILMRLWYWQMNTKFSVLKEVAEVKMMLAEIKETKETCPGSPGSTNE